MCPRQDTYLSLCLDQASKSPLHYRHGCIIVRGGKVIGQGFNHYRTGFNGGALKNGRSKTAGGMVEQKAKQKHKFSGRDVVSRGCGGGADAQMALSMHSEIMAIRSALSLSSHPSGGSARSNAWDRARCFKSPGRGKKEHRLRKEKIQEYVERVCETTAKIAGKIESHDFATQNDVWRFESGTCRLLQAQELCSQPASSEPGHRSEEEREQESSCFSTSVRSRPVSV